MICKSIEEVKHYISDKTKNIFLVYGSENYLKKEIVKEIIHQAGIVNEFNITILRDNIFLDDIIEIAQTIPFMNDLRCIFIYDFTWEDLTKKEQNKFIKFLNDVNKTTILTFIRTAVKLSTGALNLIKTIEKYVVTFEFNVKKGKELNNFIKQQFAKEKIEIKEINCKILAELCSNDMQTLMIEINKLTCYLNAFNKTTISKVDIEFMIQKNLEQNSFEISKCLLNNNLVIALQILKTLLNNSEQPTAILAGISIAFIDLFRTKLAQTNTIPLKTLLNDTAELYSGKAFRIHSAYKIASNYSIEQCKQCLKVLSDTDKRLKNNSTNPPELLREAICQINVFLNNN